MNYVGKLTGDYKVIRKVDEEHYLFTCTKCGEERIMFRTCFYRKPKCQKCGGRKNAVLFNYKGKVVSAKEIKKRDRIKFTLYL